MFYLFMHAWVMGEYKRENGSCLSILSFSFFKRRRLSSSILVMSFSMKTRRSKSPSSVTSITFLPIILSSSLLSFKSFWSNNDVLRRLQVGNLSIAVHCNSTSSSLFLSTMKTTLRPRSSYSWSLRKIGGKMIWGFSLSQPILCHRSLVHAPWTCFFSCKASFKELVENWIDGELQ